MITISSEGPQNPAPLPVPGTRAGAPVLSRLASLLDYPAPDCWTRWESVQQDLAESQPEAGEWVAGFIAAMRQAGDEPESVFLRTFEICPACSLDVSIHLFGEENYQRGAFMARLNERYAEAGFDAGGELPGHLGLLLRFYALAEAEERRELVEYCLLGPVSKMIRLLEAGHPYGLALQAVAAGLRACHPGLAPAPMPSEQDRTLGCTITLSPPGQAPVCGSGCAHR